MICSQTSLRALLRQLERTAQEKKIQSEMHVTWIHRKVSSAAHSSLILVSLFFTHQPPPPPPPLLPAPFASSPLLHLNFETAVSFETS